MTTAAIERRQDLRVSAGEHPGRINHFSPIKVLDLSGGGALVETDCWFAPDQELPLRLEPDIRMSGKVTRCGLVRIEWTSAVPRTIYHVALRFDPPPAESRRKLVGLLRSLALLAPDAPLPTALTIG